ncbi:LuxR C-terminal-related transcriptional regulator [Nonomuraea sp. NPDC001699]
MLEGITRFFEQSSQVTVVASTADPAKVPHEADVLLLDLYLQNGRPSVPVIADWSARSRVLVMSVSGEQADVVAAIQAGASGYLTKSSEPAEFHAAVVSVASGGFVLGSGLAGILHGQLATPSSLLAGRPALSPREAEVLAHLAKGRTRRQTASRMGVAESTVDTLIKRIRVKLGLGAMADLVRAADELGLRPPGE